MASMIERILLGLASTKKLTALIIIFQACVILFLLLHFNINKKNQFDYQKISKLLESSEFHIKNDSLIGLHELENDDDDDDYQNEIEKNENGTEKINETNIDNNETDFNDVEVVSGPINDNSDNELSEENQMKEQLKIKYGEENIYFKGEEKENDLKPDNAAKLKGNKVGSMFRSINRSKSQIKESKKERALIQFSGMGKLKKEISEKIINPDEKFISDKRILYSEVYEDVKTLKDIQLLLIVSSSAQKRKRRDAIRGTWWEECDSKKVKCLFFTDDINSKKLSGIKNELLHESRVYKDMVFQPIDVGVKFGYRFLYQMQWAVANYRFQYLLRVDDDIVLCLHRLLHDLNNFPKDNLQWGKVHCTSEGAIFIDEGITMFSRDLVLKFLSQNPYKMRCHVFGDQQIAIWMQDLNLDSSSIYLHDPRIHHTPSASQMREYFLELDDICATHIAVHGAYPEEMEEFWAKKRTRKYQVFKKQELSEYCEYEVLYQWNIFKDEFRYQPKYCYKKPTWGKIILESKDGQFEGREARPDRQDLWENMKFDG